MSRSYMLDTDSVSFAIRGAGNIGARTVEHRPSDLCISAISLAELRFGAAKRGSRRIEASIDAVISGIEVVPFDAVAASMYGRVSADLYAKGAPIGDFDVLIAAHALALEVTLVTRNLKHFERVKGLRSENWF